MSGVDIKEPPKGSLNVLRHVGPGIVQAGAVIGTGELLVTTRMGAKFGYIFLLGRDPLLFDQILRASRARSLLHQQ